MLIRMSITCCWFLLCLQMFQPKYVVSVLTLHGDIVILSIHVLLGNGDIGHKLLLYKET